MESGFLLEGGIDLEETVVDGPVALVENQVHDAEAFINGVEELAVAHLGFAEGLFRTELLEAGPDASGELADELDLILPP